MPDNSKGVIRAVSSIDKRSVLSAGYSGAYTPGHESAARADSESICITLTQALIRRLNHYLTQTPLYGLRPLQRRPL